MLESQTGALALYSSQVKPEHLDYNGHMNVAYYVLLFDEATDVYKSHVGLDTDYRLRTQCSTFALELHITYLRELRLNDHLQIETHLLDADTKRHHFIHTMFKRTGPKDDATAILDSSPCATMEVMSMHIDLSVRRPSPFPMQIQERISALLTEHRALTTPKQAGQIIGIKRK